MYKLYISVLGVYILPLEWPCKMPEVYKAPKLLRRVYYLDKNGVPAVTQKSAIKLIGIGTLSGWKYLFNLQGN